MRFSRRDAAVLRSTWSSPWRVVVVGVVVVAAAAATEVAAFAFARGRGVVGRGRRSWLAMAAPARLEENAEGVLYVNDRCISCSACRMFAPDTFAYSPRSGKFVVDAQPTLDDDGDGDARARLERARAAMSACPVAAIRVENSAQRNHNDLPKLTNREERLARRFVLRRPDDDDDNNNDDDDLGAPFPRPVPGLEGRGVYYLGHHNRASFGAVPYLIVGETGTTVMVDTPRFCRSSVEVVESLAGPDGPDYLLLTHVDDTADHRKWKDRYSDTLKRIFHEGDLGEHNWIGDADLENVEVLLSGDTRVLDDGAVEFRTWTLDGTELVDAAAAAAEEFVVAHTPGHSPGSVSLSFRPPPPPAAAASGTTTARRALFTGDTYAFSARENGMSGFPRYGHDLRLQAKILRGLSSSSSSSSWNLPWDAVLPGHGLPRFYEDDETKEAELAHAVDKLLNHGQRQRT